jgi:hypothetical protein
VRRTGGQGLTARPADANRYRLCRNEEISLHVSQEASMHDARARRSLWVFIWVFIVGLALARCSAVRR